MFHSFKGKFNCRHYTFLMEKYISLMKRYKADTNIKKSNIK